MEIECMQCNVKFESEEEIIENENSQECDQCGKCICDGISLKRHKKKEHEITSEEGSKDEDMETQVTESECVEFNEKFESVDKFIEHVNENECDHCGKWLCCGTYLRKHKKKDHEITSEEGSKEEENKKDSNEDEEKGEIGIMVCEVSNQPNRSADYSSQNEKLRLESAEELEEINTTEKQKVKEFEILEMTEKDTELVHQEVNNETINIVAENNETFVEILLPGK